MPAFIDLSHTLEDGMPGFKLTRDDGTETQFTARITPFMTHDESRHYYNGQAEFEITVMRCETSVGTYLDSPYHRHRDRRDISQIRLDEVILPGVVVDARGVEPHQAISLEFLPIGLEVHDKAVLFNFGWDQHWGEDAYFRYPFIDRELIDWLAAQGAKLVGVDTINIDDTADLTRPAHTIFLGQDTLIVENLTNLDQLHGKDFRFFAVPVKGKKAAAMPVRAFAEILT